MAILCKLQNCERHVFSTERQAYSIDVVEQVTPASLKTLLLIKMCHELHQATWITKTVEWYSTYVTARHGI